MSLKLQWRLLSLGLENPVVGRCVLGFCLVFFFSLPAAVAIISGELGSFKYVEGSEGSS